MQQTILDIIFSFFMVFCAFYLFSHILFSKSFYDNFFVEIMRNQLGYYNDFQKTHLNKLQKLKFFKNLFFY